jgi:laminin B (domain IV)
MRDRNVALRRGRWAPCAALLAAVALLAFAPSALADVGTNFDANASGWKVQQSDSSSQTNPTWSASGGNPNGYIRFTDADPVGDDQGGFFVNSGAPFVGNRLNYYGDNLHFDLRINGVALNAPIVYLFGQSDSGPLAAFAAPSTGPTTSWSSFDIPLFQSDWNAPAGTLTKAAFKALLGNITSIEVLADYQTNPGETTDLDNVVFQHFTGLTGIRTLTLAYSGHAFRGHLSSSDESTCPSTGVVLAVLKRTKGDDKIVGFLQTDSNGDYVLQAPAKKGTYYADAREYHTVTTRCPEAKSPVIKRG